MFNFFQAVISNTPMGRIYAQTAKPYYVAGELIQGNIVFEAKVPISANGIDLRISGYEKTEWHDKSSRTEVIRPAHTNAQGQHVPAETRSIPQYRRRRGKKSFFDQTLRIYQINGAMLPPGTHTYPFQYQLPDGLPGSFYERTPLQQQGEEMIDEDGIPPHVFYDSDDEYNGQRAHGHGHYQRSALLAVIMYKLKVTLDVNGLFTAMTGIDDLQCKVPLVIHPKLAVDLRPAMQELTKDVIVCCCINKGKCGVCARFDKLAYVAGETADVRCDIKNASTSNLKTRVILRRYLTLKSTHGNKAITEDIVQQQYDAVPEKTDSLDRKMPLQLAGEKVKPSTNGNFITCNYEYLVECAVSMGSDIHLKMPVTIYAPQPPPITGVVAMAPPVMVPPPVVVPIPMPNQPIQVQQRPPTWDDAGYLALHPDVKAAGMNGFDHYKQYGKNEGRQIQLTDGQRGIWDDAGYLNLHPDVKAAGQVGWHHYINHGKGENRAIVVKSQSPVSGPTGSWSDNGYLTLHPDVRTAGMNGFEHYKQYGKNEGRQIQLSNGISGTWDDEGYLALHPDVRAAGMNGFDHFKQYGKNENRAIAIKTSSGPSGGPNGLWDDNGYLTLHPDVRSAGMNGFDHFKQYGKNEGRQIQLTNGQRGTWDDAGYLRLHPDVKAAGMNGFDHYKQYGKNENRAIAINISSGPSGGPNGMWDDNGYLTLHPDVRAAGMNGFDHFKQYGKNENRQIQLTNGQRGTWDDAGYLRLHPDVKAAGMNGFDHYKQYGKNENRQIAVSLAAKTGSWDDNGYLTLHPDVKAAGQIGWNHYVNHGKGENRAIQLSTGARGTWDDAGYLALHPDVKAAGMNGFDHFKQYGKNEGRQIAVKA